MDKRRPDNTNGKIKKIKDQSEGNTNEIEKAKKTGK